MSESRQRPEVVEDGLDPQFFPDRAHVLHRRVEALLECPHTAVNSSFIITNVKNRLTDLYGN